MPHILVSTNVTETFLFTVLFYVLLAVYLSKISVTDQFNAQILDL